MVRIIIISLLALSISACFTPYQKQTGLTPMGGYSNEKSYGNLEKVEFSANGFTTEERAQEYTLLRIAEIGKQRKKPYFALYDSLAMSTINRKSTRPTIARHFNKPTGYAYVVFHDKKQAGDLSVSETYNKYALKYIRKTLKG